MPLHGPNKSDISKIHSEVNQIVSQRLTLTTLALTFFGVLIAWITPKTPPTPGSSIGVFVYITTILSIIILFAIFLLTHHLSHMLRIFTTYLAETEVSNWEKDWASYRSKFGYLGYTKPQAIIFLVIGFVAAVYPFVLSYAYSLLLYPIEGAVLCSLFGIAYVVFVIGMGVSKWFTKEDEIQRKWKEIKNS